MKYNYSCEICQKLSIAIRGKGQNPPRFCSNKCRGQDVKKWLRARIIWNRATKEEKEAHLKGYFEKNIIRKEGCWDWKPLAKKEKYPRMNPCRNESKISVHIYSWKLHNGDIPPGMFVCHRCDNTRCANPEHLFLGTHKDNVIDMMNKKRHLFGIKHPQAKLDDDKIVQIRKLLEMGVSLVRVARDFNVSKRTIFRIKHSKTWRHLLQKDLS